MAKRSGKEERGDAGFLSRWSERKRGGGQETPEPDANAERDAPQGEAAAQEDWSEEEVQSRLSEIEEMKQGDDFKPLLKAGVPEVVKRAALRKLWRSNPVFGILDGLNDYDLDYTIKAGVVEQVRSAYQAGKGYVYDEEKEAERQAEIAARRERDKQREKERAETDKAAGSKASKPLEDGAEDGEPEADGPESAAPDDGTQDSREQAPSKPRGSAAARRWGGGPA